MDSGGDSKVLVLCLTYSLFFLRVLGYFWFSGVFSVKADCYDFVYRFHMFVVVKEEFPLSAFGSGVHFSHRLLCLFHFVTLAHPYELIYSSLLLIQSHRVYILAHVSCDSSALHQCTTNMTLRYLFSLCFRFPLRSAHRSYSP